MNSIDNKYVDQELKNNYQYNEIFKHQRHDVLSDIECSIIEMPQNELLIDIDINNSMPFSKLRNSFKDDEIEETNFWNHVVSILFMQDLKNRYNIETNHNIEEEKRILTRGDVKYFKLLEDLIINRNDVTESINKLNLPNTRVHIILKYINNEKILEEVLNYLDNDNHFITMIYSDSEIPVDMVNNKYKVKLFNREDDDISIYKVKTYEKKI